MLSDSIQTSSIFQDGCYEQVFLATQGLSDFYGMAKGGQTWAQSTSPKADRQMVLCVEPHMYRGPHDYSLMDGLGIFSV